ncbi:MAG: helix-turn-helix domain-containing protein [Planctomycetota bacterium]
MAQLGIDASKRAGGVLAAAASAPVEGPVADTPARTLSDWERRLVIEALKKANGNKSSAAALLGLSRSQLYTRLKRFGIDGHALQSFAVEG